LEDFWEKYGPIADPDAFASWASIAAFYQGIGVLVKKGMIDIEIVNELIGNSTIIFWEKMSPEIIESREKTQRRFSSTLWNDFEYLYEEILKFRENQ
jgi:hypothetical protein